MKSTYLQPMKSRSIIITAGGTGKRMGGNQPKQFLLMNGKPVLMHTIERLHSYSPENQFILTLPGDSIAEWKKLCERHNFRIAVSVIPGGAERNDSVRNALEICTGEIIAVHDGVRPFVSDETLDNLFKAAEEHKAVIPVLPVKDSLRKVSGAKSTAAVRSEFRIVQTPQVFSAKILRKAHGQAVTPEMTDDASMVEALGEAIYLVQGNEENIKITVPLDLLIGEAVIASGFCN